MKPEKMRKIYYLLFISVLFFTGCDDELELSNPTLISSDDYITDDASAQLALDGIYDELQTTFYYGAPYMTTGLYADEFAHSGSYTSYDEFVVNLLSADNSYLETIWNNYYATIYRANAVIITLEGLGDDAVSSSVKTAVIAEAKALRAFLYFDLVRLWGALPIPTELISSNASAYNYARSSVSDVYDYILSDLNDADGNIADSDIYHFSNDAVKVLKAKIYLTQGEYASAQTALESVIGQYSLVSDYADLFVTGSNNEAILRINYSSDDKNYLAFFFYPSSLGGRREAAPNQTSLDAFDSDGGTRSEILAQTSSLSAVYLNKYSDISTGTDQPYIYRYADVLLLYAEALAQQGSSDKLATATGYVNEVRERAGMEDIDLTSSNYIDLIAQERRVEFYGEGHRWYDAVRLGIVDDVIANKDESSFTSNYQLWPIPQSEIDANGSISSGDQNPGY